jgi:hypothetical protein
MRSAALPPLIVAALVFAGAGRAQADGALPAEATSVQREQAQSRFLRGKELMAKGAFDAALAEFRASHDIVASPNTRLEIARCLLATGKLVDAYAELGRTAVEAKELKAEDNRYQRTYEAATAERADLQPKLGFVALTIENATDATRVTVGGEEIRRAAWTEPAPVAAGTTAIVVTSPGHADVTRSVTLVSGASTALAIDAQSGAPSEGAAPTLAAEAPAPTPSRKHSPLRTGAYVAGGLGIVGLATFAIAGALAHGAYDDLETACGSGPCPASKAGEIGSGRTQQTIANVGLAVGAIGVAAGATLFVLSLRSGPNDAGRRSAAVMVSPTWIGFGGTL